MKNLIKILIPTLLLNFTSPVLGFDFPERFKEYKTKGVCVGGEVIQYDKGGGRIAIEKWYTIDDDPDVEVKEIYFYKSFEELLLDKKLEFKYRKKPFVYWFDLNDDGSREAHEVLIDNSKDGINGNEYWYQIKPYSPKISKDNCA